MIRLRSPADALFGLLLFAVAAFLYWGSADLRLGTASRMGPAYVPRIMALLLAAVGFVVMARALLIEGRPIGAWPVRALLAVSGGLLAFVLLLQHVGLLAAVPVLVVLSSLGERGLRLREIAAVAVVLTAFAAVLFVQLLDLPLPLWRGGR